MTPPLSEEDHQLVYRLLTLSRTNKKLVSSSTYDAPSMPGTSIRSWKMNEYKYYNVPSPFPTLARGLFTTWVSENTQSTEGDANGKFRIVARGYDKFFNIGEVPWTTWPSLENYTSPPYVMTLKSNGCIIFIGALSPTKLVITSKHSLGPVQNAPVSHAQMGERWLIRHLESKRKTTEDLAHILWENNWTAVAELCDDSFEEHVLGYSHEKTGLHLHGINECSGHFKTMNSDFVAEFAKEWGFIETAYHIVNSMAEVRQFSDEIAKSGKWNGDAIEGFVVRCHVAQGISEDRSAPPYPPGSSFFFKLKYDEPYMMYRDWREITKSLLSAKGPIIDASVPKSKLRYPESHLYLKWVKEEISRDRRPFKEYTKGKGIIATRERFLAWLESRKDNGQKSLEDLTNTMEKMRLTENKVKFGKTIIIPIAIPGCGKTSVAIALKHLFGFGHVQSDDIAAKKPAPIFINRVVEQLQSHDVVIADKNNHLKQHRDDLRKAVIGMEPPVRLVALHWALEKPPAMIHRICSDRVMDRGENHQTLRANMTTKKHEEAIWMFIRSREELGDQEVDDIVEMDIEEDLEHCLDRAINACVQLLGLEKPAMEDIGKALAIAREYQAAKRQEDKGKKAATTKIRYYGLLPEIEVEKLVAKRLEESDIPEKARVLWDVMVKGKRITQVPHITLVHQNSLPGEKALWDRCHELFIHASPPSFTFDLGHLVYDDKLMALTVENLRAAIDPGDDTSQSALDFVTLLDDSVRKRLHITLGTRASNIAGYEARSVIESWKANPTGTKISAIPLSGISARGRMKGLN